jgi:hypothetical protein
VRAVRDKVALLGDVARIEQEHVATLRADLFDVARYVNQAADASVARADVVMDIIRVKNEQARRRGRSPSWKEDAEQSGCHGRESRGVAMLHGIQVLRFMAPHGADQ